ALPEPARGALLLLAADDDPGAATALAALPAAGPRLADLAPAEAAGLVWLDGGRVAFRHPLVRSAAYRLAPFEERSRAHTALAGALSGPAASSRPPTPRAWPATWITPWRWPARRSRMPPTRRPPRRRRRSAGRSTRA